LVALHEGFELLKAVIDAIYSKATSVVAGLYNPDIAGAVC